MKMPGQRHRAGFTLLEILVAITLFGLIAVAVAGGIRFGARVWETGRQTAEVSGAVHQTQALLRRLLSGAILVSVERDTGEPLPSFLGEEGRLLFSAPWLTSFDRAGIYQFEVTLSTPGEASQDMVVRWRGLEAARQGTDFGEADQARTLLRGIEQMSLSYFGILGEDEEPAWHARWEEQDRLPRMVSLKLVPSQVSETAWPELLVRVRTSED